MLYPDDFYKGGFKPSLILDGKHGFDLQELVPPTIFNHPSYGGARAIRFLQPSILLPLLWIKAQTGWVMQVNDWHRGGSYTQRGYRTNGPRTSAHPMGCAIDFVPKGVSIQSAFDWIQDNFDPLFSLGLRRLESPKTATTWIHMDSVLCPNDLDMISRRQFTVFTK